MAGEPLYGVLFPYQKAQIEAWCWGECGGGLCGCIDIGPAHVVPCNDAHCPHLDKQMDESIGESQGRPLFLRKLHDVPPSTRTMRGNK